MPRRSDCSRPSFCAPHRAVPVHVLSLAAALALLPGARIARCATSPESSPPRGPVVATRPVQTQAAAEFQLAYKFRPEQEVRMLLTVGSQIRLQKGAHVEVNTIESITERHFHVATVNTDGSAILELVIDNVKIAYSLNGDPPISYNTRGNAPPPKGLENVRECIGRATRVRVDTRGRVSPLDPAQPNPADDPDFLVVLPEKPVRIGQEWFDDFQARVHVSPQLTQKITLRRRYTLTAVNNNVAVIRVVTAEVTPIDDPQVLAGMVQLTPKGTALLDLSQGTLTLRDLHCDRVEVGALGTASSIAGVSNTRETLR